MHSTIQAKQLQPASRSRRKEWLSFLYEIIVPEDYSMLFANNLCKFIIHRLPLLPPTWPLNSKSMSKRRISRLC
jgi:hypothetical protein